MYLNCHSYYSLRYGTFSEIELLELAQKNDVQSLALTDINNTSACLNYIRKAKDYDIRPVVGIDFRNGNKQVYVGLAKNNEGFQELNAFLSHHSENKIKLPELAPPFENCYIIYPFEHVLQLEKTDFSDNEFIGVSTEELRKLRFSKLKNLENKLVVLQTVTIRGKKDFNAHRLLRAIDKNTLLSKLDKSEECKLTDKMISLDEIHEAFGDFPNIIENTNRILNNCHIEFGFGEHRVSQNLRLYT
ncbi:MAG: PHP domain-containing protein, partial [Gelidibacter sp.]